MLIPDSTPCRRIIGESNYSLLREIQASPLSAEVRNHLWIWFFRDRALVLYDANKELGMNQERTLLVGEKRL